MNGQWNEDMPFPGEPGYGQGPYPSPMNPIGVGAPPAPPREVELAFRAGVAQVVLGLLGTALAFLFSDPLAQVRDQSRAQAAAGGGATLPDSFFTTIAVAGVVAGLVFTAVEVFFLVRVRQGRNWARITLTIFYALGVLLTIPGLLLEPALTAGSVTGVVGAALEIAVLVLLYRPASNRYFAGRRP